MAPMETSTASREELVALIAEQRVVIERLQARVRELEGGAGKIRGLAGNKVEPKKPGDPSAEKEPRKKRQHNFVRRRAECPDEVVERACDVCPGCGTGLTGGSVNRTRQVIEVRPSPAIVVEHRYVERCCPYCERRFTPKAEIAGVVVGKSRLGVSLVSLIATLREVGRLPIRTIRWYLRTFHTLSLSDGAIVGALKSVAGRAGGLVAGLHKRVRASPHVHADETGWREGGENGYVWTFSTLDTRLFVRRGRDQGVVREILGLDSGEDTRFCGVLVSDFYAGYNCYMGQHQRCWAHLLRDVNDIVRAHPDNHDLTVWAEGMRATYDPAVAWVRNHPDEPQRIRRQARLLLESRLQGVCASYLADDTAPQAVLCRRIEKYIKELLVFVVAPGVPPDNNAAERSLRPLMIARKISGGTRAPRGTDTKMTLASAFGTWMVRGLDPYRACLHLLDSPQP